ncbi:uncharacterized protein YlxW (UPF0749 family) [Oikeobacillus pervagus]|uniref:Uncharacterized protein YlxW (UPF0749 family) n=1 Tax=Oikeobacillus pervagus TaxID=1325931 RepID=A0AAJ1T219_9BACI|nr:DUF881 domain-containing protein [Oikeobacillus pervagus]MDQ0215246.1 uncharacterized protein YlxW (UPF0749 family) [Oikeobacillus pervagus]
MKKKKTIISFTIITLIIGFMLAILYQSVQSYQEKRDTRDIWELREELTKEKQNQSNLLNEIRSIEAKLKKYEHQEKESGEEILRETLAELKKETGLTEVKGPGIIISVEPVEEEILLGKKIEDISPSLLTRLVNELNMYEAEYISIAGERIVNSTVIRDINGETKINGESIGTGPFKVHVIVKDAKKAERLYNHMKVSKSVDEFFVENFRVNISEPNPEVVIPAYSKSIRIKEMQPVKE